MAATMINLWLIAAGALAIAAVTAVARRSGRSESSLAPPSTAVPPVSEEWLSNARGKEELHS
jgi:hypothetical protein